MHMSDLQYQGRFVWRDLNTSDVEQSRQFFTRLFGWETEDFEMGPDRTYTMFKLPGGKTFGGIMPLDPAQGAPSHWISYISADDVDDFCARASDVGATVLFGPLDIPEVGRWAVLSDPQGASFSAFSEADRSQIANPQGTQPHGGVAWNELMTSDVDAATAFYTRMFGWTSQVADVGTGPYTLFSNNGTMVSGMGKKPDDMPVSAWTTYFEVTDIDQAVEQVEELGGQILFPIMEIPQTGRITWAADPAGAVFGMMQSEPMAG
jgi:predicted enzyme related to lactoylglutathione lyase